MNIRKIFVRALAMTLTLVMLVVGFTLPSSAAEKEGDNSEDLGSVVTVLVQYFKANAHYLYYWDYDPDGEGEVLPEAMVVTATGDRTGSVSGLSLHNTNFDFTIELHEAYSTAVFSNSGSCDLDGSVVFSHNTYETPYGSEVWVWGSVDFSARDINGNRYSYSHDGDGFRMYYCGVDGWYARLTS